MNKKIIFSAGGTGGHIFPAINLMKDFCQKGYKVVLVTDKRGKNFINNYSEFKSYILKTDTPTNKKFLDKILSLLVIFYSLLRSILILRNVISLVKLWMTSKSEFTAKFSRMQRIPQRELLDLMK